MTKPKKQSKEKRYYEALVSIAQTLGTGACSANKCQGCDWEMRDAARTAREAIGWPLADKAKPTQVPEGLQCVQCHTESPKHHKMSCDPPYKYKHAPKNWERAIIKRKARQGVKECICNVEWGAGENGRSVCGADCPVHPPTGACKKCGKKPIYGEICARCELLETGAHG